MLLTFFFVFLKRHLDVIRACQHAVWLHGDIISRRQRSEFKNVWGSWKINFECLRLDFISYFFNILSHIFSSPLFHTSFSIEMRKEGKCVSLNVLFSSSSFLQIFAFCFPFLSLIYSQRCSYEILKECGNRKVFREICFIYIERNICCWEKRGLGLTGKKLYSN